MYIELDDGRQAGMEVGSEGARKDMEGGREGEKGEGGMEGR